MTEFDKGTIVGVGLAVYFTVLYRLVTKPLAAYLRQRWEKRKQAKARKQVSA